MKTGGVHTRLSLFMLLIIMAAATSARGSAALFVEEPYGFFGGLNPTGHAAIYLNHICAASPTLLRHCTAGENGVVISRYSDVAHFDWVAIPLLPYLYAVDQAEDVPGWVDADTVAFMRQSYAEAHLQSLISIPAVAHSKTAIPQLLGVAYTRKIYSFEISTTDEQDDQLIAEYNDSANQSHFNLFTNNCADFSRQLINSLFPGAMNRSITADMAITTPKHIAKRLASYAHRHEELEFSEFVIPQVPGSIHRSHQPRGVVESLLKSKKYAVPIAVLNPYILGAIAVTYLSTGRFNLAKNAPEIDVLDQARTLVTGMPYTSTTRPPTTAPATTPGSSD